MIVGITQGGPDLAARVRDALTAGIDRVLVREAALPGWVERMAQDFPGALVLHTRMQGAAALPAPVALHFASDALPSAWIPPHGQAFSVSTHSVAEAARARAAGAAWVLLSPIWRSPSKPEDTRPPLGVDVLGAVAGCVALGGVDPGRVPLCRAAGAYGVAGMGGLFGARDTARAVEAWRAAWRSAAG
jgi:thiamine-phosphate pyrophosphorylase